jgi:hypothetical protein
MPHRDGRMNQEVKMRRPIHICVLTIALLLMNLLSNSPVLALSHPERRYLEPESGASYYVATDGSDDNPGTETRPFRTLGKGVSVLSPGDVLYIRGGTYKEEVTISTRGTPDQPVLVSAYPGEHPVIDGAGVSSGEYLVHLRGSYITVQGLEIKNAAIRGVGVSGDNNTARSLNVHHSYKSGILLTGRNGLVEKCTVWQNSQRHHVDGRTSGCLSASGSTGGVIRDNVVFNNWGEAVSTLKAYGTIIEDNVVYDNFAINIYVDNTPQTVVRDNFVHHSGDPEWDSAPGISICDESYSSGRAASDGLEVYNNLVYGGNGCFYVQTGSCWTGLRNALIANNTFVNAGRQATVIIGSRDHTGSRVVNNIVVQEDSLPVAIAPGDPEISFSHNLWSKKPPSEARGSGDVIALPRFAGSPDNAIPLRPYVFRLTAGSPAIDAGLRLDAVRSDFEGRARPVGSGYDTGAYEYFVSGPLDYHSYLPLAIRDR